MKKNSILEYDERIKSRKVKDWNSDTANNKIKDWFEFQETRHNFINHFNEFPDLEKLSYKESIRKMNEIVKEKIDLPKLEAIDSKDNYMTMARLFNTQGISKKEAFDNAKKSIAYANNIARFNSTLSYNNKMVDNINGTMRGLFINPYEAQILFETTSIGYQGVTIPIKESFSTPISISSDYLDGRDIKDITKYLQNINLLETIKTAIIDSQVFGGSVVTPMFEVNNEPQYLGDLKDLKYYFDKNVKLLSLICFDRYCTLPAFDNDGIYTLRMRSTLPVALKTIFNNEIIKPEWYSGFNVLTTSLSKLIRPDNFGLSIFARAAKAVYSFEQQLQFLNYALGQLSIIVFNSKSKPYENGGSADLTWDNPFGDNQVQDIKAQLAIMQESANVQRGLYLNDIEVTALNRTFTGIGEIINATDKQVSNAFGVRQDLLFGSLKGGLGNQTDELITPMQTKYREMYRNSIIKVLKWCVFGFYAERNFTYTKGNKNIKWKFDDFIKMLNNIDVVYEDNIKTNENILKEYGVNTILNMLEKRLLLPSQANSYIRDIPIINKIIGSSDTNECIDLADTLQKIGIEATITELEAIKAINTAIKDKKNPLEPKKDDVISDNKVIYDKNNPNQKPLEDFGKVDKNGVVNPISPSDRLTAQNPLFKESKITSHEKGV